MASVIRCTELPNDAVGGLQDGLANSLATEQLTAQQLLAEVASNPSMDEFFRRCPEMPDSFKRVIRTKARDERASWGGRDNG